jgi:hypothetical protein
MDGGRNRIARQKCMIETYDSSWEKKEDTRDKGSMSREKKVEKSIAVLVCPSGSYPSAMVWLVSAYESRLGCTISAFDALAAAGGRRTTRGDGCDDPESPAPPHLPPSAAPPPHPTPRAAPPAKGSYGAGVCSAAMLADVGGGTVASPRGRIRGIITSEVEFARAIAKGGVRCRALIKESGAHS